MKQAEFKEFKKIVLEDYTQKNVIFYQVYLWFQLTDRQLDNLRDSIINTFPDRLEFDDNGGLRLPNGLTVIKRKEKQ